MTTNAVPNSKVDLEDLVKTNDTGWVNENTAILVVHGIGNQLPIQTLDQFGRGLIKNYRKKYGDDISITHEIVAKRGEAGDWFDNILRLHNKNSENFIDIYEYYWANYTEDKASWKDLNAWLQGVVKGASSFYKRNEQMGQHYKDQSPFFNSTTGEFNSFTYWFFMAFTSKLFLVLDLLSRGLLGLLSAIPLLGKLADTLLQSYGESMVRNLCNVLGDVAVYNVVDPKSKFYSVRRCIMDGAVKSITFLLERTTDPNLDINALAKKAKEDKIFKSAEECKAIDDRVSNTLSNTDLYYPSVLVAGHSLGSQVSYDAINKINLLVNESNVITYNADGTCKVGQKKHIKLQLRGFITFGCPLDKIVFFLRENVPDNEYLRQQFLDNYHGFKQRPLNFVDRQKLNEDYLPASCKLQKMLDDIKWRNYYDNRDYVSGGLLFSCYLYTCG
jgi:hypothetical protein